MNTMDLLKLMMALSGGFAEGNASDELEKLDDLLTEAGIHVSGRIMSPVRDQEVL